MKIMLDDIATGWQQKARRFAEEELIPNEVDAEMNGGALAPEIRLRHKKMAIELGFSSMDVAWHCGRLTRLRFGNNWGE